MPVSKDGVVELRAKLEALAKQEDDVAAVAELKNELEAAIYSSREKLESLPRNAWLIRASI